MRFRIDLKIFIFLTLFYFTGQIKIYLIIMFFSVIHEIGHIVMGLILKMKLIKLEVMPCGLSVAFSAEPNDLNFKIKKGNLLELKKILVALSGPFTSLAIAVIYTKISPIYISSQEVIYSNILILFFNLIPIYPLDGGRILKGALYIELGNKQSKILINKISNMTMIILTIISSITIYYFKNIAIFLICIFLWDITLKENKIFKTNMKIYELLDYK